MHARKIAAAALAAGLMLSAAACSDDDSKDTTTTTDGDKSSTGTSMDDSTGTSMDDSTGTSMDDADMKKSLDDLSNSDINEYLETNFPTEWALVDWDIITWSAFSGYTVYIESGSTVDQATDVCEAVGDIVYEYTDEQTIEISVDDTIVVVSETLGDCTAA